MTLSRDAFLKPVEAPREKVHIEALGGSVWVYGMTVRERSVFEKQFHNAKGQRTAKFPELRERTIVQCVRNDDGSPMFTVDDIPALGNQFACIIEPLFDAANRLSGGGEATEGNSEATETDS